MPDALDASNEAPRPNVRNDSNFAKVQKIENSIIGEIYSNKKRSKADATLINQSIFNGGMVNHVSPGLTPSSESKGTEVSEEKQDKGLQL